MNGSRSGIPRERKNRSQANEMLWIATFGFDLVRLRNVLVFLVWRIRQVSPLSSKTAWPLIVTRFCSDRTVMGANRPAFAASGELRWILTTPESGQTCYLVPLYADRLQERIVSKNESIGLESAHGPG